MYRTILFVCVCVIFFHVRRYGFDINVTYEELVAPENRAHTSTTSSADTEVGMVLWWDGLGWWDGV
jgi:hypothetical protein